MIVFYNKITGMCIRIANGLAENVIVNGYASIEGELILHDMKDIIYADVEDQHISYTDIDGKTIFKRFSDLKKGKPLELRMATIEKTSIKHTNDIINNTNAMSIIESKVTPTVEKIL